MKQSELFSSTIKEIPKDELSFNAQMLIRAGFIDKTIAGAYSFLPLGWRVLEKIKQIVREEMFALGSQEINMSSLSGRESWEKTGRWDGFDVLFKIKASDSKDYVLNPTHEEVVVPLLKKFISSYKDLPLSVFQIQTKFRNEKRAKSGIMRGREFLMKDLYSFHADKEDLEVFYDKAIQAYKKVFDRLGLGDKTYLTYSSGGSFSKYSHEFQTLSQAGEDLIYVCDNCKVAINKEIINEQNSCPICGEKELIEKKAAEVANIFKLGTNYSEPFSLNFKNKEGKEQLVIMGCYGIGLSRIMGVIVEENNDERGIIWPESVAPFRLHLISLNENEEAEKIYNSLLEKGIDVLYDDRNLSAGEKFADSDLIGCPYRLVVSSKTLKESKIEFKKRNSQDCQLLNIEEIVSILN